VLELPDMLIKLSVLPNRGDLSHLLVWLERSRAVWGYTGGAYLPA